MNVNMIVSHVSPRLCVLSLVDSALSVDPSCSTSSPGGHLVDGLPPAANSRFPRVVASLREDTSISETCPLEESASHHELEFAAGGKPSTRLPPGELVEQLGTPST